ncbi:hypothetical protein [Mesorhizobium sp. CN2-181]|uniref:hypothetical protein n=1 Tax=Mesorhizobium yinganensis TaxID=3157707 RepID=UPI0032B71C1D
MQVTGLAGAVATNAAAVAADKAATQLARQQAEAAVASVIYADTAAGLAATTNGQFFLVIGINGGMVVASVYKNVAGSAVAQNLQHPSLAAYEALAPAVDIDLMTLAGITQPVLKSPGGRAYPLGSGGSRVQRDGTLSTPNWEMNIIGVAAGEKPMLAMKSRGGKLVFLAGGPVDPMKVPAQASGSGGSLFSKTQYDYAQSLANAERARKMGQDLSPLLRMTAGVRVAPHGGQSKDAASDNARTYATLARIALLGLKANAVTISRDGRCLMTGDTFLTYDGNSRVFHDIRSNMTHGTNVDRIVTPDEYARGDYPVNARGEWCGVLRPFIRRALQCAWLGIPYAADPALMEIAGSWSKTDGLAADVFAGDGAARSLSYIDVVLAALASPSHIDPSYVFPAAIGTRGVESVPIKHGEADNGTNGGAGTANYIAIRSAWYSTFMAKLGLAFGQTAPFAVLERQVGGPYATLLNVAADQQAAMGNDISGASRWVFMTSQDYECPNFKNVGGGHPGAGDPHHSLAGAVILAVRDGIAEHEISDRGVPHFIPEPLANGFYVGNRFMIPVVSKYPGLHEAPMPWGVTPTMAKHRGVSFKSNAGALNTVTSINVVPGPEYTLIEGTCASDIAGFNNGQTGRNDGGEYLGFTNFRDGMLPDIPIKLPFDRNQIQYGNVAYNSGVPGNGYVDDPRTNGFGRYIEDIPGWVGDYDWGNPLAIKSFTMVPLGV